MFMSYDSLSSCTKISNYFTKVLEPKILATETVDSGSIPSQVKRKTIKIGIHSFRAWR